MVQRTAETVANPQVKIVCFDLGGVLVRISRTWQEALDAAGVSCPLGQLALPLSACPVFDSFQAGALGTHEYLLGLAEFLGGLPREDTLAVHNAILLEPYPGTLELVNALHDAGYRTGCLSNTNGPHWENMCDSSRLPAIAGLQLKMASHDVQLEKPDPRIYRAFEQASGCTGPEILYFDDTAAHVEAAAAMGWRAYLIDHDGDPAGQMRRIVGRERLAV